ncbi:MULTISPECIES: hypothetical protein [unclassified Nocardioides]|uniref:hypothetical protein n=1 Tax=unclassified Nocardioides TaxID=2615069 RepID=UPI0012E3A974|nr:MULTISPECIES: hypothetical protein [unclassified Nocardioides]
MPDVTPSPTRRRGTRWTSLGYGVAIPSGLDGDDLWWAELAAWSAIQPASYAFTGLTAARAHELWLPPLPIHLPHFVAMQESSARRRRPALRVTRARQAPAKVTINGIAFSPVPEALLACARDLSLLDLVVLIDSALHLEKCSLEELQTLARTSRPGSRSLREGLRWVDGRAESAWETLLRLLHTSCGIAVTPQVDLHDADGRFLGRADLLVDGSFTLQEYDGAHHFRDRGQYSRDRRRDSRLGTSGYVRHGWSAHELLHDGWLILKEARSALGQPIGVQDIRPWFDLLNRSLFTPSGTALACARWQITPDGQ